MPGMRSRPFTLLDALILIAATAVGFGLTRGLSGMAMITSRDSVYFANERPEFSGHADDNSSYYTDAHGRHLCRYWSGLVMFCSQRTALWPCPTLAAWTLAVMILALVRPRPPRRRLFDRPGAVAGVAFVAAFAALTLIFPQSLIFYRSSGWSVHWRCWWAMICFTLPRSAALAVSVSWLTLALVGRWRPDRRWLDRLGRLLGGCWIVLGVLRVISSWIEVFY
jgi:hypothetical protein